MSEVTLLLEAIERGQPSASDELFAVVYEELRSMAFSKMRSERAEHTLNATALVHEAFIRLVGDKKELAWENRAHFFGTASEAMRRVLVDSARSKKAKKRGGDLAKSELFEHSLAFDGVDENILEVDEALQKLESESPLIAAMVKLRYFAGLTLPQIANVQDISLRKAERNWTYAKAWFSQELSND